MGFGEVAAFAELPFLVLFEEDGADQAGGGVALGEDLGDAGAVTHHHAHRARHRGFPPR